MVDHNDLLARADEFLATALPGHVPDLIADLAAALRGLRDTIMSSYNREDVRSAVAEAMGFASMCWDPTPTGVFQSDKASDAVTELTQFIVELGSLGRADWIFDPYLNVHTPCCSQRSGRWRCGNGPLTGDDIMSGDCGEQHNPTGLSMNEAASLQVDPVKIPNPDDDVSPGPITREQVRSAMADVTIRLLFPLHPDQNAALADAVMALIESTQPKVLARSTVVREPSPHLNPSLSPHLVIERVEALPGTHVIIVEETS